MINPFEIRKKKVIIPLLINIPHSSTYIPTEIKVNFFLSDNDLQKELLKPLEISFIASLSIANIFSHILEIFRCMQRNMSVKIVVMIGNKYDNNVKLKCLDLLLKLE